MGEGPSRAWNLEGGLAGPCHTSSHSPTAASDLLECKSGHVPPLLKTLCSPLTRAQLSDPISSHSFTGSLQACLQAFALARPSGLLPTPPIP